MTLHRAHVYVPDHAGLQWPEVTVFFEVPLGVAPMTQLDALITRVWGLPAQRVEAYNLAAEPELRSFWGEGQVTERADRDVCLLQVGDGPQGPAYCTPERTQYLVGPLWLERLAHARQRINAQQQRRRREAMQQLLRETTSLAHVPGCMAPLDHTVGRGL